MAYKSKLGPTLHVRTCRVTVLDLKNGWTDCAQIWYTVRDRLVGCRAQVIGGTPAQFHTCKAHCLARSVGRPKRRYTGRKQRSTKTVLHTVTDMALQAMDNGHICILVLLDLSKCFDVPHAKLLEKLSVYGVDVQWFQLFSASFAAGADEGCRWCESPVR